MAIFKLAAPLVTVAAVGDQPAKTIESLDLNLDALTGLDYQMCEREAIVASGDITPLLDPRINVGMQVQVASRACGVPVAILSQMGIRDFATLTAIVRDFFLAGD